MSHLFLIICFSLTPDWQKNREENCQGIMIMEIGNWKVTPTHFLDLMANLFYWSINHEFLMDGGVSINAFQSNRKTLQIPNFRWKFQRFSEKTSIHGHSKSEKLQFSHIETKSDQFQCCFVTLSIFISKKLVIIFRNKFTLWF